VTESALAVLFPEAEALVGDLRRRYDPSAAFGAPPHVTVLVPFAPPDEIDEAVLADLRDLFAGVPAIETVFREARRFPRTLYLAPEPEERFRDLTERVVARWPAHPPYGGVFDDVIPHLTVADGVDEDVLEACRARVEPGLPLRAIAREVRLLVGANEPPGWTVRGRFAMGRRILGGRPCRHARNKPGTRRAFFPHVLPRFA
jgi:hypothetical protein